VQRFAHGDMVRMRQLLAADGSNQQSLDSPGRTSMLATDGVFSMDGDLAQLDQLVPTCRQAKSWLLVDEAHAFGVIGDGGRGSFEALGLNARDPGIIRVGTLGKAFGSFGAFVAGSRELIELLIQTARTYIYTTALPPAVAAASLAALVIIRDEPERRRHLRERVDQFRQGAESLGLNLMPSTTPIQPILIGDADNAVSASEQLRRQGIWVTAIRPPTVPQGTARLRVTLSAGHSREHVDCLLDALATLNLPKGNRP